MPAYQSMLHPLSWKFGSRWSRRNAGPHTWAPMSPPVGVVSSKTRSAPGFSGLRWTTFIITTVVTTQRQRGDRRPARCARSATAPGPSASGRRTMRRPARAGHDGGRGVRRPSRRASRREPRSSSRLVDGRRPSGVVDRGASTTATVESWLGLAGRQSPGRLVRFPRPSRPAMMPAVTAGFGGHRSGEQQPGRVERDVGGDRHAEAAGDAAGRRRRRGRRRTARGTRRGGSGSSANHADGGEPRRRRG